MAQLRGHLRSCLVRGRRVPLVKQARCLRGYKNGVVLTLSKRIDVMSVFLRFDTTYFRGELTGHVRVIWYNFTTDMRLSRACTWPQGHFYEGSLIEIHLN